MTLKEIAHLAGVSPATVSIVINNGKGVSEETRKRVIRLLDEDGYFDKKPRKFLGTIWLLQYKTTGSVIDGCEAFFMEVISSLEKGAKENDYKFMTATFNQENISETLSMVKQDDNDGILVLATEMQNADLAPIKKLGLPFVAIDNGFEHESVDCVLMNNRDIVYDSVKYLHKLGHKQIGYLESSIHTNNFIARKHGYQKALLDCGLTADAAFCFSLPPNSAGAYTEMKNYLLSGKPMPTAFAADADSIAIGVIKALKEYGLKIPEDISVVGFDDIDFASMLEPALTTMRVSRERIADLAIARLTEKINKRDASIVKMYVGGELILRSSAKAPQ